MFSWLRHLIRGPDPLPPLGFKPNFIDLDDARTDSVILTIENDDVTPMEFVVSILVSYFEMGEKQAIEHMLKVHTEGSADIRAMSRRDAEKLLAGIDTQIDLHGHPLRCTIKQLLVR